MTEPMDSGQDIEGNDTYMTEVRDDTRGPDVAPCSSSDSTRTRVNVMMKGGLLACGGGVDVAGHHT